MESYDRVLVAGGAAAILFAARLSRGEGWLRGVGIFAALAECERELNRERTLAGFERDCRPYGGRTPF